MITKKDMVATIAEKENVPKSLVDDIVTDTIELIKESLKKNDDVKIAGLGSFSVKTVQKRERLNKKTGKMVKPEAYNIPSFSIDVTFKEMLGASFMAK